MIVGSESGLKYRGARLLLEPPSSYLSLMSTDPVLPTAPTESTQSVPSPNVDATASTGRGGTPSAKEATPSVGPGTPMDTDGGAASKDVPPAPKDFGPVLESDALSSELVKLWEDLKRENVQEFGKSSVSLRPSREVPC